MLHPAVKFLFEEIKRQDLYVNGVADAAGITPTCMYSWREGRRQPTIANLDQALQAIGYKLTIIDTINYKGDEI